MSLKKIVAKAVAICAVMVIGAQADYVWIAPQNNQTKYDSLQDPIAIPSNANNTI